MEGQWGPIKKTRLVNLGNVEKPPHPQFSAQRAPEGYGSGFELSLEIRIKGSKLGLKKGSYFRVC